MAARQAFYRGDIARTILAYHREHDGLLTESDLAEFRVEIEPPLKAAFAGLDVYTCGPWCQGPMLLQSLALLDAARLRAMGHNTVEYIHHVLEAIKLAAADREAYYGDPRFVDVPMAGLLAADYSARRAAMIRDNAAALGTPNLQLVEGAAPEALRDLPTPDAVFLGGGTGKAGVIDAVWHALRPGGRLVAHAVTIESEQALFAGYHAHGGDLTRLSVARVTPVGALHGTVVVPKRVVKPAACWPAKENSARL